MDGKIIVQFGSIPHLYVVASVKRQLSILEDLLKDAGYTIRYEKGHFRTGYCVVHERRVVVVNKFFNPEDRVRKLTELVMELEIDRQVLNEKQRQLLEKLHQSTSL